KGVVFVAIDSDKADVEGAKDPLVALREAQKAHGLDGKLPLVFDKDGALAKQFSASATAPHAFVLDAKGVLRYAGAIDDDPVSDGCQCNALGTISPTVQTSSTMPRNIQVWRGNAPNDFTSALTLSNMKTFMTPEAPYRSAARICRTHNRMFIACPLPVSAGSTL